MIWRKFVLLPLFLLLILLACLAMKKTSDEELNQWRFDQGRNPVSLRIEGDQRLGRLYLGEAKVLLFAVKNAMGFNKLMQAEGEREIDGTRIRARSISGQDFIEIDTSRSTVVAGVAAGPESCIITLISIPLFVQPMKNPREIQTDEKLNIDYIKTYYSVQVKNCPTCQEIAWELTFNYSKPFEPRHYFNSGSIPQMGVDPGKDDPNNHSIYSLSFPCWAEIIDRGQDANGHYIIWKAFTEGMDPYSRTGLGILLIKASISNVRGILCDQEAKIDVDCCKKKADLRKVEIWWEDFGTCQPYIMYGDVAICKMPTEVPMGGTAGLVWYGCTSPQQPLYAIPEINGSCLPVEWTLSGPIELWGSKKDDNIIYFKCLEGGCNSEARIILRDRCGTEYIVRGRPCCEDAETLSINYISLLMSCGQQQQFTPDGGCGPYTWAVTSGGGSITQDGLYTAPATNPNCVDNPTIQLTDCCGSTAQVQLAVNCYTGFEIAFRYCTQQNISCSWAVEGNSIYFDGQLDRYDYLCDGTMYYHLTSVTPTTLICPSTGCPSCSNCYCSPCTPEFDCGGQPCNSYRDKRTEEMKAAGCCPINPWTGLPF